ncbi:hypothetical protein LS73_006755 [Helicobacter muridarum]|uniref:Outer membrane beta-barrel protein n=1 Tax=Helicobacter muridarum TaxID=216 RepID=A0A099TY89_9HELI|nr:hypothetical protein [Helicobacter muridarum]TLD99767.1 hypothetical protein LS73_006755 [Helicobacter muridarum]STQ87001.1 Uncharacterised protein [Helicobacter muridarum]
MIIFNQKVNQVFCKSISRSIIVISTWLMMLTIQNVHAEETTSPIEDKDSGYGKLKIAWGFGYGFDWRKSNLIKNTSNQKTSGIDNKYGLIASFQYTLNPSVFIELPIIISYLAPSTRYFNSYHNNSGDGYNIDVSILGNYYLIVKNGFSFLPKAGLGYTFGYMWQTSTRLVIDKNINDTSSVIQSSFFIRLGAEVGYFKHHIGIFFNYYFLTNEFSSIKMRTAQTSANAAIQPPVTIDSSNTYLDSFGTNIYYMYRF